MADLQSPHGERPDPMALQRYFASFEGIGRHLPRLAVALTKEGRVSRAEIWALSRNLIRLSRSMMALSLKYQGSTQSERLRPRLSLDQQGSGFPAAAELFYLANDAVQARAQLASMPSEEELRERLLREILGGLKLPGGLHYALSQRLYAQHLWEGGLYLARNDLEALWLSEGAGARHWLLSWALYDDQMNLPVIYLLEVADRGDLPLPQDAARWSDLQAHLRAQSLNWLKLPIIAQALAADFHDLQPLGLKRFHIGPFYGAGVTLQPGPLREALAGNENDWAMVWTVECLKGLERVREKTGWFSSAERQIFSRDPFLMAGAENVATVTRRFALLSEEVFHALQEHNPPGLGDVRCFLRRREHPAQR